MMGKVFNNIVYEIKLYLDQQGEISFELDIIDTIESLMIKESGWSFTVYCISYWILTFTNIKFFLMYMKRVVTVGFLIMIAPLISVGYALDKVKDNKAQTFSNWLTELSINIFIQPIHAVIYLIFMYTAGEIAKQSMVVALIFLVGLTRIEKIVLYLFNLKGATSLQSLDEQRKKG